MQMLAASGKGQSHQADVYRCYKVDDDNEKEFPTNCNASRVSYQSILE